MPDPVAWTMVEPGWDVVDAHGEKVGTVEQIIGAPDLDIFDGFSVRKGLDILAGPDRLRRWVNTAESSAAYRGPVRRPHRGARRLGSRQVAGRRSVAHT